MATGGWWRITTKGDEIYLYGFSRGAFTARSLAGIIARCGLLRADSLISFSQLFERYKKGETVRAIHELIRDKANSESFDYEERALLQHASYRRNLIKMVGVWDTVGSIGLPFGRFKNISRGMLKFHNTNLSTTIEHSYQALAAGEAARSGRFWRFAMRRRAWCGKWSWRRG